MRISRKGNVSSGDRIFIYFFMYVWFFNVIFRHKTSLPPYTELKKYFYVQKNGLRLYAISPFFIVIIRFLRFVDDFAADDGTEDIVILIHNGEVGAFAHFDTAALVVQAEVFGGVCGSEIDRVGK